MRSSVSVQGRYATITSPVPGEPHATPGRAEVRRFLPDREDGADRRYRADLALAFRWARRTATLRREGRIRHVDESDRIERGTDILYRHAINGWNGPSGKRMPARGGNWNLTDEQVEAAVDYMIHNSQ